MGCGAAGGLLCHQMWPPSWISPKLRISQEKEKIEIFFAENLKCKIIKHFTAFCAHFVFTPKRKNTQFLSKMASPTATYDVISRNHSNRCSPILCQNVCKGYAHCY